MIVITTPLACVGLLAIAYLGSLFANFSRRLSTVTRMVDRSRWFRLSSGLVALAAASQVIRGTAALAPQDIVPSVLLNPWFPILSFHIPLAIGVVLDLLLVLYYWGWILKERIE